LSDNKSKFIEYLEEQRKQEREMHRIRMLVARSIAEKHDVHICDCEGCKYYWMITAIERDGKLYELLPNVKKMINNEGIQLHLRDFQIFLQRSIQPLWIVYANDKRMVYKEI
jgi:hypothetical protein